MRLLTVTVTLALVAAYASALTETDDFPDECFGYAIAEIGESIQGTVDHHDEVDHIGLNVTEDDVGGNVTVEFDSETFHVDFAVYTPDCGQDVVPLEHRACEVADCPAGHTHTDGAGHQQCQGQGHVMECSGAGDGVQDEDSVTFSPDEAGVFVLVISFDAKSFHTNNAGGGDDCKRGCDTCGEVCVEDSSQPSGGGAGGSRKGTTIESCHVTCAEETVLYDVRSSSDGRSVTFAE